MTRHVAAVDPKLSRDAILQRAGLLDEQNQPTPELIRLAPDFSLHSEDVGLLVGGIITQRQRTFDMGGIAFHAAERITGNQTRARELLALVAPAANATMEEHIRSPDAKFFSNDGVQSARLQRGKNQRRSGFSFEL